MRASWTAIALAAWTLMLLTSASASLTSGSLLPTNPVMNGGFEQHRDTVPEAIEGVEVIGDGSAADEAIFWEAGDDAMDASTDKPVLFFDVNGDGDREAVIEPCPSKCMGETLVQQTHKLPRAMSGSFQTYRFVVEHGTVPEQAKVVMHLQANPSDTQHPLPAGVISRPFYDISLIFEGEDLEPDSIGHVLLDPVTEGETTCPTVDIDLDGEVDDPWPPCTDFQDDWGEASEEERRDMLGRTRLIDHGFHLWDRGEGTVVIDNVRMSGATSIAQELARGNVRFNVCPVDACVLDPRIG